MTRFLIVDDHEQSLYMLGALLTGHGYEVETAVHGREALDKAAITPPDMLITDILMPVMDGFTLCRHWMQDEQLKHIPFVFYTATYVDKKDEELALSLGAARYIIKPTDPSLLVSLLEEVFEKYQHGRLPLPEVALTEEPLFLERYSSRVVHKLEDKIRQLEQTNRSLKTLYRASTNLAVIKSQRALVSHALRTVVKAMEYQYANFFIFDQTEKTFRLLEAVGYSGEEFARLKQELVFALGEEAGLVGLVGQTRKPLILADVTKDSRWIPLQAAIRSALFVPVVYESRLLGVVSFLSVKSGTFSKEDTRSLTILTNNVAIAIENARLYTAQQQYNRQLQEEVEVRTAELQAALELAQAAERLKSQFVSDVNHELRSPLSNIKLYLSLLEQGRPEKQAHYLAVLHEETNRLQRLIEDMLDLSQLDAGDIDVNLKSINLNVLMGTLIGDWGDVVADKGLSLTHDLAEKLPACLADPQLLFQVLGNLTVNAINYTPSGGMITLKTETAVAKGQTWVTASIGDTGPGIPEEDQPHLFERFYRGTAGRDSGTAGTGLGLAICEEIIARHNGHITFTSESGVGSTFTVWLHPA